MSGWFCSTYCKYLLLDHGFLLIQPYHSVSTAKNHFVEQVSFSISKLNIDIELKDFQKPEVSLANRTVFQTLSDYHFPQHFKAWLISYTLNCDWYLCKEHIKHSQARVSNRQHTITKQMPWGSDLWLILFPLDIGQLYIVTFRLGTAVKVIFFLSSSKFSCRIQFWHKCRL